MKTLLGTSTKLYEIKKSNFYAVCGPLTNKDDFKDILNQVKKEYPNATHYCYAYKVNEISKSSDDGEPSGTAGRPILTAISNKDLSNVYAIVVRYFGGIKLGASGLLRAYVDSVVNCLNISKFGVYTELNVYHFDDISYEDFNVLKNAINKQANIENISYSEGVSFDIISINDISSILDEILKGKFKPNEIYKTTKIMEEKL